MPFTNNGKNKMLNAVGIVSASLHTADPGTTGTAEVTGGTYTRKAIGFGAASGGVLTATTNPTFDVPAGVTVTHIGVWDNGGVLIHTDQLRDSNGAVIAGGQNFSVAGTLTVTQTVYDLNG